MKSGCLGTTAGAEVKYGGLSLAEKDRLRPGRNVLRMNPDSLGRPPIDKRKVDALLASGIVVRVVNGVDTKINTRAALADAMGIGYNVLWRLLNGTGGWTHAFLLAEILAVPLQSLMLSPFWEPPIRGPALPKETQDHLDRAHAAELSGDLAEAVHLYEDAARLLNNSKRIRKDVAHRIDNRLKMNQDWRSRLRRALADSDQATRIRVYDEHWLPLPEMATKNEAHAQGKRHYTVIVMVRRERSVICMTRAPGQTYAGRLDFLGGHSRPADEGPLGTALRESREEVLLSLGRHRIPVENEWLEPVCEHRQFEVDCVLKNRQGKVVGRNRERSSLFVLTVPPHPGLRIRFQDEDRFGLGFVDAPAGQHSLSDLVLKYRERAQGCENDRVDGPVSEVFADGAGRILRECMLNPETTEELSRYFDLAPILAPLPREK
jgi:8-oxo-dGTP pyrophosphatase MutT (NUDIX family)